MKRQHSVVLIAATLALSWLAMQAVHELGHVIAANVTGGQVATVVLYPTTISYTELVANPRPLFVAWMGPIVGSIFPLLMLAIVRFRRLRGWYVFKFFTGFCLIANGAYLSFGSLDRVGDAGDILRYGSPFVLLWLFGLITIPLGLWFWYGLGPEFGIGGEADRGVAFTVVTLLVATIALEVLLSHPTAG